MRLTRRFLGVACLEGNLGEEAVNESVGELPYEMIARLNILADWCILCFSQMLNSAPCTHSMEQMKHSCH